MRQVPFSGQVEAETRNNRHCDSQPENFKEKKCIAMHIEWAWKMDYDNFTQFVE